MLFITGVSLGFTLVGFILVAKAGEVTMHRLHLDFWDVATWFGIAEAPVDELAARRAR